MNMRFAPVVALILHAACASTGQVSRPDIPTTVATVTPKSVIQPDETAQREGSWAGWAYLDGGGDFPMRVSLQNSAGGQWTGHIVLPSEDIESQLSEVSWMASDLRFGFQLNDGRTVEFKGASREGVVSGRFELGDRPGEFEIIRSAVPLVHPTSVSAAASVGIYRRPGSAGVNLEKWFWGELIYTDLDTGDSGTLLAVSEASLIAGSAMYVPDSVTAWATLVYAGKEVPGELVWHRVGATPQVLSRVVLRERELTFTQGEAVLSGTLILPSGEGPHPVAVFLGGGSWRSRNYSRSLAQVFAAHGIGAFIYDKRGHGDSSGDRVVAFETTARDAVAAVHRVAKEPDVRADQIGLTGYSRGGWFAPLAASMSDEVSFLVLWAAPVVSPASQETTRRLTALKNAGASASELEQARRYLELLYEFGRSGRGWEQYSAARERVMSRGWSVLGGPESNDPEDWQWIRLNGHYDPVPALKRVKVPIIALYGEQDSSVDPELNAQLLEATVSAAGATNVVVRRVPNASHTFRIVNPGEPIPPLHRSGGYSPQQWRLPIDWLVALLGLEGER